MMDCALVIDGERLLDSGYGTMFATKYIQHIMYVKRFFSTWNDSQVINTLRPRQNGRHFADDTFRHIFLNGNVTILIRISMKFVPKGPINNNPTLVQIMGWRRSGDSPLSEPRIVSLLTHICVTRPQWVNTETYKWEVGIALGIGMVPSGNKPLHEPILTHFYEAIWLH